MKKILLFLAIGLFLQAPIVAEAQVLKKIAKKAKKKTEEAVEKEVEKAFEEKREDSIAAVEKQAKEKERGPEPTAASQEPKLVWAKYDFVPGPNIIFDDNQENEENGEFPSRWDLVRGNAEIAEFGGDMVIMLRDGAPSIVPYFKDSQDDYLPDVFTIEFDLFYPGNGRFEAYLYDRKNQKSGSPTGYTYIEITHETMELGKSRSKLPEENIKKSRWMHIAIAYTKGKLKAYMDETRLLNIPRIDFDPKGLTLYTYHAKNDNLFYVKNVRIAKGGVKYYDRIMEDGKIIANGIRFDVNKATLRPESMGVINEIHGLLTDHPEIKFSIEGHTDSDGEFDFNQELSERRANTVMMQLVAMGISADRLVSKGHGESKPMNTNDTPEGKAANRRVEFVKMSEEG